MQPEVSARSHTQQPVCIPAVEPVCYSKSLYIKLLPRQANCGMALAFGLFRKCSKARNRTKQMKYRIIIALILLGLIIMSGPKPTAQESASIQATATVVSSLSVTGDNGLDFQTVTPGVPKSVDKATSASAGHFVISGSGTDEVQLQFTTLPSQLAAGGNTMPLSFGATDASYGTDQGTATAMNPTGVVTTNLVAGALEVWLGGTVNPGAGQAGGNYAASVVLQVTLTGN